MWVSGVTALMHVARLGHFSLTALLLQRGADVDLANHVPRRPDNLRTLTSVEEGNRSHVRRAPQPRRHS